MSLICTLKIRSRIIYNRKYVVALELLTLVIKNVKKSQIFCEKVDLVLRSDELLLLNLLFYSYYWMIAKTTRYLTVHITNSQKRDCLFFYFLSIAVMTKKSNNAQVEV